MLPIVSPATTTTAITALLICTPNYRINVVNYKQMLIGKIPQQQFTTADNVDGHRMHKFVFFILAYIVQMSYQWAAKHLHLLGQQYAT